MSNYIVLINLSNRPDEREWVDSANGVLPERVVASVAVDVLTTYSEQLQDMKDKVNSAIQFFKQQY